MESGEPVSDGRRVAPSVAVVGGGIVGSAIGVWLAREGYAVTVYERDLAGRPASTGNAGVIALSEISPLARPGTLASVPGWLLDPLGPLSVRPADLPALTPWLLRFVAAARPSQVASGTAALGFLMKTALADHQELARRGGLSGHMRRTGSLHIFDSDAGFRSGEAAWKERARHGVDYRVISPDEARAMVPALTGAFSHAVFAPADWTVSSPLGVLNGLRRRLEGEGLIQAANVDAVEAASAGILVTTADGPRTFDRAVIAGGLWSRDLVRRLGLGVVLETERGYNTTFAGLAMDLPMPVFFDDHGFCATPLDDGVRVGGAVELADAEAPPNYQRAAAMRKKMRRYVPDLPEDGGSEWMGCRPATPDSLPVIGAHPGEPRIVFAFGHGHLGLTLSAVTARHVAGVLTGRADRSLAPFGIERFQ
ncbi:MAG: FAD-dependent oxidoreductase [Bauldia sp.]